MTLQGPQSTAARARKYRELLKRRKANAEAQKRSRGKPVSRKETESYTDSSKCFPGTDESTESRDVRTTALVDLFQWRLPPQEDMAVVNEISLLKKQIRTDLDAADDVMNPRIRSICMSCGYKLSRSSFRVLSSHERGKLLSILEGRTYDNGKLQDGNGISLKYCTRCLRDIKIGRTPLTALCHGWNFTEELPSELLILSQQERLLISLRLPCVYTWRLQGGYGQYAMKGPPVSFANPVPNLARALPWKPSAVFSLQLENGKRVDIRTSAIFNALLWLKRNNSLYSTIDIDESAMKEIEEIENTNVLRTPSHGDEAPRERTVLEPSLQEMEDSEKREASRGAQGPLDGEALFFLEKSAVNGMEDIGDTARCQQLIQHMLKPFTHRKSNKIPSYDAAQHIESYFPVLFPHGKGGPASLRRSITLAHWSRQVLSVHCSRFRRDIDFIFFVNAVLRRKRLSGLAFNAPILNRTSNGLKEVRELLNNGSDSKDVQKRIDSLIRSGSLNASFESLRGSPAFWATLKYTSWAYLVYFGPCQLFLTMSVADVIDPYVFMEIDDDMSFESARRLSTQDRAKLLAENPVAATNVFYRRVEAIFDHFLFGKTRPFQNVEAYLGRVEQQERKSPHLHLLLWLSSKAPTRTGISEKDAKEIARFIETFCSAMIPPDDLTPLERIPDPPQGFPLPILRKPTIRSDCILKITGKEKHDVLSKPCDSQAFGGSSESRKVLGTQMFAAQYHICSSYCRPKGVPCRFLFPYLLQQRGTIGRVWRQPGDLRTVAFCPRSDPFLNGTHPMLTAMVKANTDVTVITGNSIAECAYVCSYATKSDKNLMMSIRTLKKLTELEESGIEERKLLAEIARGAESVRVIGGQEACDNLLSNPLIFMSARVLSISVSFVLEHDGAMSEEQKQKRIEQRGIFKTQNLLNELPPDEYVAVPPSKIQREQRETNSNRHFPPKIHETIQDYMVRPRHLEALTATEFYLDYIVCKSTKQERIRCGNMLLRVRNEDSKRVQKILRLRKRPSNRPQITNILNVKTRGRADESSPDFCAAALVLHLPFRSVGNLLNGKSVTARIEEVLGEPEKYHQVSRYVRRSLEIKGVPRIDLEKDGDVQDSSIPSMERECAEHGDDQASDCESDFDMEQDPLEGLPPLIRKESDEKSCDVLKIWNGVTNQDSVLKFQNESFLKYITKCRSHGVENANRALISEEFQDTQKPKERKDHPAADVISNSNDSDIFHLKKRIFKSCRNDEQKQWLRKVFSYLQVYYHYGDLNDYENSEELKQTCLKNPVMLTNTPGGTDKSWLIEKLKEFVYRAIPSFVHPILDEDEYEDEDVALRQFRRSEILAESRKQFGRLGRVAVFAPSGVAADNCGGFTFHDALRTFPISKSTIALDPPLARISQLAKDFSDVVLIVIDEFSMCNIVLIEYLDQIMRILRPAFAHRKFGGVPVILTGDGFQLPVVRGCGILSDKAKVPSLLRGAYINCTENVSS